MRLQAFGARVLAPAAAAVLAASLAGSAGATTPLSGDVNMIANSTIDGFNISNSYNAAWAAVPAGLGSSVDALNVDANGNSVDTHGTSVASWASADSGSVTFRNYGWDVNTADPYKANLTDNRGGDDWDYTFVADQNGTITMAYNVTGSGFTFGLWGWSIGFNGSGSGGPVINPTDPTTSGVFTGLLQAGQTYTISLSGNPNIFNDGGGGNFSGSMLGQFDWQITSGGVPEPATWGLMLAGFGLMGAALRRRALAA
jgi:PEP-CTERM motif